MQTIGALPVSWYRAVRSLGRTVSLLRNIRGAVQCRALFVRFAPLGALHDILENQTWTRHSCSNRQ